MLIIPGMGAAGDPVRARTVTGEPTSGMTQGAPTTAIWKPPTVPIEGESYEEMRERQRRLIRRPGETEEDARRRVAAEDAAAAAGARRRWPLILGGLAVVGGGAWWFLRRRG